jgi:hypothetical protein
MAAQRKRLGLSAADAAHWGDPERAGLVPAQLVNLSRNCIDVRLVRRDGALHGIQRAASPNPGALQKVRMRQLNVHADADSRVLASGADFALLALFVTELPNTLLVQLFGNSNADHPLFSVYIVYREGLTTFEVTTRLQVVQSSLSVAEILRLFTDGAEFRRTVVVPLVQAVRQHFSARPGR